MQIVRELDRARWQTFVDQHPDGNIFQTPAMFEVFARTRGHHPRLWAATAADGAILALLPVVHLTLLDGPFKALTTRAVAYGSLLVAPTPQGQAALGPLLAAYTQAGGEGALFTECRHLADLRPLHPVLAAHGFVYEDHLNFLIDLTQPTETLWRNLNKRKRDKIRASRNKGMVVETVTDPSQLAIAYRFLQEVYSRVQVPLADASLFEAALAVLAPQGWFQVLLARVGDAYVGTLLLLRYHGRVLYWYIGSDRAYSAWGPSELLVWEAIEQAQAAGDHTFDLGGGGRPEQAYGPREFKAKFGGVEVNPGRHVRVHAPWRLRLSQVGYHVYRRVYA